MCQRLGIGLLPILMAFISAGTFVATYIIAVANNHVEPLFPYISDTGTTTPESCLFSQFLNITAALAVVIMYSRYRQVHFLVNNSHPSLLRLNFVALVFGLVSAAGMSLVANFQESVIKEVHFLGAFGVFVFGTIYALMHAALSYRMYPDYNGINIARWRLAIGLTALVFMVLAALGGAIATAQWHKNPPSKDDTEHWKPDDPGYSWHLVSTFSEWIMALSFLVYFLTYVRDFRLLKLSVKTEVIVINLADPVPTEATGLLA